MIRKYNAIYLDTSAAMTRNFENFTKNIFPFLVDQDTNIIVPQATMRELKRLSVSDCLIKRNAALKAMDFIKRCSGKNHVFIFEGNPNSTQSADSYLLEKAMHARTKNEKLLIISQDYQLCLDVMQLNRMASSFAPASNVFRISSDGNLEKFDFSRPVYKPQHKQYANASNLLRRMSV